MMRRRSRTDDALKTLHSTGEMQQNHHRERLEADLSARYRERYEPSRRWTMMFDPKIPAARWAMITLAVLLLGVAACSTPTTSEVDMGQSLRFEIPAAAKAGDAFEAMLSGSQGLSSYLQAQPGVDEVNVSFSEEINGPTVIEALVWGQQLDGAQLAEALEAEFPVLQSAALVDVAALTGRVEESLGEKVGRTLFKLDIGGGSEEEMREQILAQLKAQGFSGDAVVDIKTDGETTTIGLELRDSGKGYETEDVIDIRTTTDPGEIEIGGDAGDEVTTTTSDDGKTVKKTVEVKKEK